MLRKCFNPAGTGRRMARPVFPENDASVIEGEKAVYKDLRIGWIFMGAVLFNGKIEYRGAAFLSGLLPNV